MFELKCSTGIFQCIEATDLELETQKQDPVRYHEAWQGVCSSNAILIPGGFGIRGMEGKIMATSWARKNKIPYLGIKIIIIILGPPKK